MSKHGTEAHKRRKATHPQALRRATRDVTRTHRGVFRQLIIAMRDAIVPLCY